MRKSIETNKIPTILVGQRERNRLLLLCSQAFRKDTQISSKHKTDENYATGSRLTLHTNGLRKFIRIKQELLDT